MMFYRYQNKVCFKNYIRKIGDVINWTKFINFYGENKILEVLSTSKYKKIVVAYFHEAKKFANLLRFCKISFKNVIHYLARCLPRFFQDLIMFPNSFVTGLGTVIEGSVF